MPEGKRNFENWLKAYAEYTHISEAPPIMHFYVGCSMIAGALRRQVWIDALHYQYTPNLYIIICGPAGVVTKSSTVRVGLDLLRAIPGIVLGPQSSTWQNLAAAMEQSKYSFDYLNGTGEKHTTITSAMTCAPTELGSFLRMDDGQFVSLLTDLYDGQVGAWTHGTKTTGSTVIENPWINFIGATTPSWLAGNFPVRSIDDGLTSRIIFVYGDQKWQYIAYPQRHVRRGDHLELRRMLIEDLTEISLMAGECELTEEAYEWGDSWYRTFWEKTPIHLRGDRFGGYRARKQAHMHKLAMVLSAAESSSKIVELRHLQWAERMLEQAEVHMLKVFEGMGLVDEGRYVRELVGHVKAHGFLTPQELFRLTLNTVPTRQFPDLVQAAIRAGLLSSAIKDSTKGLVYVGPTALAPSQDIPHEDGGAEPYHQ